jgi:predicted permease
MVEWLGEIWRRSRTLFRGERFDRELDEEMGLHRELRERERRVGGGLTGEERYATQRKFGNALEMRERGHDMWGVNWLEDSARDLRYGLRVLRKNPGFTAVAILTLALGIGVNTAVFSVVNAALVKSLPYPDAGRLMHLWETYGGHSITDQREASWPNYQDWVQRQKSFEGIAGYWSAQFTVTENGEPGILNGALVTSNFFPTLGANPILGRAFTAADEQPGAARVVILSNGMWRRDFGSDSSVIGRSLNMGGGTFLIVGVLPKEFQFAPLGSAEVWAPLIPRADQATRRNFHWLHVIGRLRNGVSQEQSRADMNVIAGQLAAQFPDSNSGTGVSVITLREQITGEIRPVLLALFGTAGLVLLIACANMANLYLARAATRQREVALRMALGAGRRRIIQQILVECGAVSIAGAALGFLVAKPVIGLALLAMPEDILTYLPFLKTVTLDWSVFAFGFGVVILTTLGFGLLPALRASQVNVNEALKEGARTVEGTARQRTRDLLAVCEIALALVLLTGAGVLLHSLSRLLTADPGFDTRNLLTVQVLARRSQYPDSASINAMQKRLFARVEQLPGVVSVGAIDTPPLMGGGTVSVAVEGRPLARLDEAQEVNTRGISPGYFRAMKIPLVSGRFFNEQDDAAHPNVLVINQTLAKILFPNDSALGRRLIFAGAPGQPAAEIVGVVGDEKLGSLDSAITPILYDPMPQDVSRGPTLIVRTGANPASVASALRAAIREVDRNLIVIHMITMDGTISTSPATFLRRFPALLIGVFATLALMLAAIGTYGVIAYFVAKRTREIGIRMALGAERRQIIGLVAGRGMRIAGIGISAGLAASLLLTRSLQSLLFHVAPFDPLAFGGAAVVLAAVAFVACYVPARRAARVDPMTCLRNE